MIFDHVQITCPLAVVGETVRFWEEIVGLARVEKPNSRPGAWFRVDDRVTLHVGVEESPDNARSKRHVCLRVSDLAEAERKFRAAGVEILPDTQPDPGWARFYVRDPAGNRVEIGCPT
jgi:catechol 2,3-dioxygenase-like lactoylglutathione lyase family enzyme